MNTLQEFAAPIGRLVAHGAGAWSFDNRMARNA